MNVRSVSAPDPVDVTSESMSKIVSLSPPASLVKARRRCLQLRPSLSGSTPHGQDGQLVSLRDRQIAAWSLGDKLVGPGLTTSLPASSTVIVLRCTHRLELLNELRQFESAVLHLDSVAYAKFLNAIKGKDRKSNEPCNELISQRWFEV